MKLLIRIVPAILCLGILTCAGLMGLVYYKETHLPAVGSYDVIIVLGAQVKPDGTPSVALERRLTAAYESHQETGKPIIVCGGQGGNEPIAEGTLMHRWLTERNVPEADIFEENRSVNTRENLLGAKDIMAENGFLKALVVSSDYHVSRALALCRSLGIDAVGKGSPSKPEYFIKNHIREGLSWIKFYLEELL